MANDLRFVTKFNTGRKPHKYITVRHKDGVAYCIYIGRYYYNSHKLYQYSFAKIGFNKIGEIIIKFNSINNRLNNGKKDITIFSVTHNKGTAQITLKNQANMLGLNTTHKLLLSSTENIDNDLLFVLEKEHVKK
jgi:hypothetical protein